VKSDVETLSPTRVKLTVEVPFDEFKPSVDAALGRIAKTVNIPGFRKGKVPARVIEQRFGREVVLDEAVQDAVPKAYEEAIRTHSIVPAGRPDVEVTGVGDGQPLAFTAEVDVRPEFELPDFSELVVTVPAATPDDADIDEQVNALAGRFATLTEVDRASADGDVVIVDVSGATPEGDALDELAGTAMSYELGTDGMLPGFDDAVRGASAGDVRTFDFTPGNGDWAGIPLTVTVTVSGVREKELPTIDDDFAQLASEFDTVADLRADMTARLTRVRRLEQGAVARDRVLEVLLEAVDIPLPEGAITAEVDAHFEDGHEGDDDHRAEVEANARTALKSQFILDKIAEREQVTVGESELSAWLIQQAPRYGMTPDAFAKALVEAGQVGMAMQDIRRAKALAVVLESAKVVDSDGNDVDLEALTAELRAEAMAEAMAEYGDHEGHDHEGHDHEGHDHGDDETPAAPAGPGSAAALPTF
jgi:trigger factor